MATHDAGADDRTEAPTARRLQRARDEGQVGVSRELPGLAALGAFGLVLAFTAATGLHRLLARLAIPLRRMELPPGAALRLAEGTWLVAAAPVLVASFLAVTLAMVGQTGLLLSARPLKPDLSRIDPMAGLRRLFGAAGAMEAGKALLRLLAMGVAGWWALRGVLPTLGGLPFRDARAVPAAAATIAERTLLAVLIVQTAVTVLDVIWVRLRHARGLRMTRQEIRDEQKESDGDPAIKARIRRIRVQRARRRIAAAVPKATVVVTNPTHYAVALAYDRAAGAAPRVVAKGVDSMAARIRDIASMHRIPQVADPPLARALYRLEIDTEIPPEHYKAVAELIAYVWRLADRAGAGAAR